MIFKNNIFPERISLKMSALDGLKKLEKILLIYSGNNVITCGTPKPVNKST